MSVFPPGVRGKRKVKKVNGAHQSRKSLQVNANGMRDVQDEI